MHAETYRLCPTLDQDALAQRFQDSGQVQIRGFLEPSGAVELYNALKCSDDWRLVINQGDKVFELDRVAQRALTPQSRAELDAAIHAAARYGFQYCFESIRVPDSESTRRDKLDVLSAFAAFLSSPPVLSLFRHITGSAAIDFADAQATAYGLGHFLNAHDDLVEGKHRKAAYVFGLSPVWRAEWGGLLLFHRQDGSIAECYVPTFNALTLFAVPQVHSVSMVAPFAAQRRYSVTGWLRTRA